MNDNALAIRGAIEWTPVEKELAKKTVCKGASDTEFDLFMAFCKKTQLDPFARQIYSVRRKQWNSQTRGYEEAQIIQVSIDGFRLTAERTHKYTGQVGPWWCGKDGDWKEVWLADEPPAAAKVGVMRSDFQLPLYAVALFKAYVQTNSNGEAISRWKADPAGMLAKCAESLALRRAFPQELSGLYTTEEMGGQADSTVIEAPWQPEPQHHPAIEPTVVSHLPVEVIAPNGEAAQDSIDDEIRAESNGDRPETKLEPKTTIPDLPSKKMWTAWRELVESAQSMGLTVEALPDDVTNVQMAEAGKALRARIATAEAQIK
jgi:phage recombination protein Bet